MPSRGGNRRYSQSAGLYREFNAIELMPYFLLVQTSLDIIEMKLVVTRPLTPDEETTLKDPVNASFSYPFVLLIAYVDEIPRDASGKFHNIYSEVLDAKRPCVSYPGPRLGSLGA